MRVVYQGKKGRFYVWLVEHPPLQNAIRQLGRGGITGNVRGAIAGLFKETLRQYSPKLTGRLSRRWKVDVLVNGTIRLQNPQNYAWYQDNRTRNRGYIMRGIKVALATAMRLVTTRSTVARVPGPLPGYIRQPVGTFDRRAARGARAAVTRGR